MQTEAATPRPEETCPLVIDAAPQSQRAWATFQIKSIDAQQRIIEGIASTPKTDRMGDVVEPLGAQFSLPMPLLWQHDAKQPIGHVIEAKATEDGISFKAKIAQGNEPGKLKDRLDEAWQSIKMGLVRGVSIGFNALKFDFLKSGGVIFKEWEWLELSAVTIPANMEASIHQIRAADVKVAQSDSVQQITPKAATGQSEKPAGASATKPQRRSSVAKQTIGEQLAEFETRRGTKAARLEELMTKATDDSRTLEDAEQEEYDTIEREVEAIDGHLVRMRKLQQMNVAAAKHVPTVDDSGSVNLSVRNNPVISVRPNRPKEMGLVRLAIAKMGGVKYHMSAADFAKQNPAWDADSELHAALANPVGFRKTTVNPLDTTTSAKADDLVPAAQHLGAEFVEFLRPMTVIGRLPGIRRVPFNVSIPVQTGGSTVNWVGEGKPKPLSGITTDNITLRWAKLAGIVTFTEELMRFSNPSVETLVRDDLAAQIVQFMDEQFLSPSVAAVSNVSPGSITNGASGTDTAAGTSAANLRTDIKDALVAFDTANIPLDGIVILMRPSQAILIANMVSTIDQPIFPGISINGGTLDGMPVVLSNSVPSGDVIFVKPSELLMADDGGINVDVSTEATLVMSDSPTSTDSATHSLWQRNEIGIRVERYVTWARRRNAAVYYYTSANYGG